LDGVALVSNSDLHSPSNLARNANVFQGEPDFFAMLDGLARRDPAVCGGTIDLFPEEGKYHLDGHRACGVVFTPAESLARDTCCPVCGEPLTLGVLHRVEALADRPAGAPPPARALPYRSIIPLPELLSDLLGKNKTSRKVTQEYRRLLTCFGPEMAILLDLEPREIEHDATPGLAEAIQSVRAGRVQRQGGYDGVYGVIRVSRA
jgi:PHP family Zn ribbon phosphoesterase